MYEKLKAKGCQFCTTKKNIKVWIPAGCICNTCKKNLDNIRKYKLGIPTPRITKEMHLKKNGVKNVYMINKIISLILCSMVLKIPGFNFKGLFKTDKRTKELFPQSSGLAEGLTGSNPDIYQGVMVADGKSSTNDQNLTSTYADLTDMTFTFNLHKAGKVLLIFSCKWIGPPDEGAYAALIKAVADGVDIIGTERADKLDLYESGGNIVFETQSIVAWNYLATSAIIDLAEGEHTIKIQGKKIGAVGSDLSISDRRFDMIVWAAPVQI